VLHPVRLLPRKKPSNLFTPRISGKEKMFHKIGTRRKLKLSKAAGFFRWKIKMYLARMRKSVRTIT
jgi:hypothetical protein